MQKVVTSCGDADAGGARLAAMSLKHPTHRHALARREGQGSSGCRRRTRLTDAEDNGHAARDRLQRDWIEMANDFAHMFDPNGLWPIDHHERPVLQAVLRRRRHRQTEVRRGMRSRRKGDQSGVRQARERIGT